MNNEYSIYFKEEYSKIGVYIVPHKVEVMNKSLFTIKIGYIDLDEDTHCFRCTDSERMTLDVMDSIVSHWRQWEVDRSKSPI